MDHYGATNPAEFFAVATETFFEKPGRMRKHHRELFDVLQAYYRIDPQDWQQPAEGDH
jgi:Mlc titration factor MtfA (ptsG expression regulator)